MDLFFITGSKGKFEEVQKIIPSIKQIDIDLPEIQEINPRKVIAAKLIAAFEHKKGQFIVEDTSLYFTALNGLPGPLIKWFMKTVGNDGLARMVSKLKSKKASAKTVIGYAKNSADIQYFEGEISGEIVKPRGDKGFGWDAIFLPNGSRKTFGEMDLDEKMRFSMREVAAKKLLKSISLK